MKQELLEAVSKQQIIKSLNGETFDVNGLLKRIEELWEESSLNSSLNYTPKILWVYFLKILSILKKAGLSLHEIENVLQLVNDPIWMLCYITEKKFQNAVSSEHMKKLNSIMSIKSNDELIEWAEDFKKNHYNLLKEELLKVSIKMIYKPIIEGKNFEIYEIHNFNEARAIAADTYWCVAGSSEGPRYCTKYLKNANLYALMLDDWKRKFLLTVPNERVYNLIKNEFESEINKISYKKLIGVSAVKREITRTKKVDLDSLINYKFPNTYVSTFNYKILQKIIDNDDHGYSRSITLESLFSQVMNTPKMIKFLRIFNNKFYQDATSEFYGNFQDIFKESLYDVISQNFKRVFYPVSDIIKHRDNVFDVLTIFISSRYLHNVFPRGETFSFYKEIVSKLSSEEIEANLKSRFKRKINTILKEIDVSEAPLFEFADKTNRHISVAPYVEYYNQISPRVKELLDWWKKADYSYEGVFQIFYEGVKDMLEKKLQKELSLISSEDLKQIYTLKKNFYDYKKTLLLDTYNNIVQEANAVFNSLSKEEVVQNVIKSLMSDTSLGIDFKLKSSIKINPKHLLEIDPLRYKDDPKYILGDLILYGALKDFDVNSIYSIYRIIMGKRRKIL